MCPTCKTRERYKTHSYCKECERAYYRKAYQVEKSAKPAKPKKVYGKCARCASDGPFYASDKSYCKACRRAAANTAHRQDLSKAWRRRHLLNNYGLTPEIFEAMRQERNDCCDICSKRMTKPCVDHCHKEGHVRGLLCSQCNTAIGLLQDDPRILRTALEYVSRPRLVIKKDM